MANPQRSVNKAEHSQAVGGLPSSIHESQLKSDGSLQRNPVVIKPSVPEERLAYHRQDGYVQLPYFPSTPQSGTNAADLQAAPFIPSIPISPIRNTSRSNNILEGSIMHLAGGFQGASNRPISRIENLRNKLHPDYDEDFDNCMTKKLQPSEMRKAHVMAWHKRMVQNINNYYQEITKNDPDNQDVELHYNRDMDFVNIRADKLYKEILENVEKNMDNYAKDCMRLVEDPDATIRYNTLDEDDLLKIASFRPLGRNPPTDEQLKALGYAVRAIREQPVIPQVIAPNNPQMLVPVPLNPRPQTVLPVVQQPLVGPVRNDGQIVPQRIDQVPRIPVEPANARPVRNNGQVIPNTIAPNQAAGRLQPPRLHPVQNVEEVNPRGIAPTMPQRVEIVEHIEHRPDGDVSRCTIHGIDKGWGDDVSAYGPMCVCTTGFNPLVANGDQDRCRCICKKLGPHPDELLELELAEMEELERCIDRWHRMRRRVIAQHACRYK